MHNPVLLVFVKLLITGTSNVDDNVIKQFEYGTLGDGYVWASWCLLRA